MAQTRDESSPPERRKPTFCIGDKAFFNACHQFVMNIPAHRFQIIAGYPIYLCDITIADKFTVLIIMSRWERHNLIHKSRQILGLTCKYDDSFSS